MNKVAVVITTYNLEKYIAQALDSVLMQKTNFSYKIIVADDCSTDNTIRILKEYRSKYPEKIELMLNKKNEGSLANSNRVFDGLQSEYFSFLDGDDYWLGEDHLQKQVDYLDTHREYMLCGGNTQYLVNDKLSGYVIKREKTNTSYSFCSLLRDEIPFVHTSALLIRNSIFVNGLPQCYKDAVNTFENCALRGEDFRRIIHLELGKMYVMKDVLSVYRIHSKGIWQGSSSATRVIESAIGYNFYKKYFGKTYGDYFEIKAIKSYRAMMNTLIIECGLLKDYNLNTKETKLLNGLLMDIKKDDVIRKPISKIRIKLLKVLIDLFEG